MQERCQTDFLFKMVTIICVRDIEYSLLSKQGECPLQRPCNVFVVTDYRGVLIYHYTWYIACSVF